MARTGQTSFAQLTPDARLRKSHKTANDTIRNEWAAIGDSLGECLSSVQELELDFTNAFCPFGCCRDFDMLPEYLRTLQPKVVRVLGLMTGEEEKVKKLILDVMTPPGWAAPEGFKVDINPEKDPWAKWRIFETEETGKRGD